MLFQGFNWESCNKAGGWYNFLQNSVSDIANAGVTHVWLPPPSQSIDEAPEGTLQFNSSLIIDISINVNDYTNVLINMPEDQ